MRSTQNLAQITLNEYLVPGDLAIDATIRHGDITRFLASRVGDTGKVLAFSDVKAEIDDVATSLFLSGLHNRVERICHYELPGTNNARCGCIVSSRRNHGCHNPNEHR